LNGNARQTQRGPKTTLGVNPDGTRVWLSIQAPFGYIRINTPRYFEILEDEMSRVQFTGARTSDVSDALYGAARKAASRIAELIREAAPVDTGELRASIQVVDPTDYVVLSQANEETGALLLEG
jgi:hypothetical protein